jgi:glucan phosphoethanolaminetransferase (alkaline phosphatase superfamily)
VFNSIALVPSVLGFIVIISLIICKYFQKPYIFLVIVVLAAILYQRETNRENMRTDNFEEALINVSKFIIVTGISGYAVLRIVGLFLPGFD